MKRYHLFLFFLLAFALPVAGGQRGDVNSDGAVNIMDATILIDFILGGTQIDENNADMNSDGAVNIMDVTILIDYLLAGVEFEPEPETFTVNGISFTMIPVEGGSSMMGATAEQGSDASSREFPVHEVMVSSFYIGETEVTQELWKAVMGDNPSYFVSDLFFPVESVSWQDCQEFIAMLNIMTGETFRLPCEAEWEFAARGGNLSEGYKYAGSNNLESVAWYSYNDSWDLRGTGAYGTHVVGTRMPNELELYDMSGNVHEWCQDWYGPYSDAAQIDPMGPMTGSTHVYRGGNWYFDEWFCRVSFRNGLSPDYRSYGLGLRLAKSI